MQKGCSDLFKCLGSVTGEAAVVSAKKKLIFSGLSEWQTSVCEAEIVVTVFYRKTSKTTCGQSRCFAYVITFVHPHGRVLWLFCR